MANSPVFPSHLTDLLNKTVICIDSASYPKSSNPFYFTIYQLLKAYLAGQIAFGTKYVVSFTPETLKKYAKSFASLRGRQLLSCNTQSFNI